jgi:hypothetical protein
MLSKIYCRISDIAENFSPLQECPTNILPFSPILEGPKKAQSDIAIHGYWTKCPPMSKIKLQKMSPVLALNLMVNKGGI